MIILTPRKPRWARILAPNHWAEDLHLSFAANKELAKEHARWRHFGMEDRRALEGGSRGVPALAARVAEERNRVSGDELTEEAGRVHADLVIKGKEKAQDARRQSANRHTDERYEMHKKQHRGSIKSKTKGMV